MEILRGVHGIRSLLITESAAIRIDYNLARVYYFTHTTRGPCDSPNRPELDKGILASAVPNKARSLNLTPSLRVETQFPPGTSLNFPTHRSIQGTPLSLSAQPLATYLGLYINDQVKEGNWLIRSIILDMWQHGKVLKTNVVHSVLNRSKRTMPM